MTFSKSPISDANSIRSSIFPYVISNSYIIFPSKRNFLFSLINARNSLISEFLFKNNSIKRVLIKLNPKL